MNINPQPVLWHDYELIDSGGFEKLERFGQYVLARPEPQAIWKKSLSDEQWLKQAHVRFIRDKGGAEKETDRGRWDFLKKMPEQWFIEYHLQDIRIKFRLGLTAFKHVGLFPEQADNWNFIAERVRKLRTPGAQVLNLFAYTGGASLAARAAGADVTHVDAVKTVVTWSRENMEASGLEGIRWIVEDAAKFVRREVRREKQYHGIILDPPAYGRGPEGEKWVLEDGLPAMMEDCSRLLAPGGFLVLNLYSMGYSALVAENLLKSYSGKLQNVGSGELSFTDRFSKKLPLGVYSRGVNGGSI